jgi:hypothetical protein
MGFIAFILGLVLPTKKIMEETCKIVEDGIEYVCDIEGAKIFRKRK